MTRFEAIVEGWRSCELRTDYAAFEGRTWLLETNGYAILATPSDAEPHGEPGPASKLFDYEMARAKLVSRDIAPTRAWLRTLRSSIIPCPSCDGKSTPVVDCKACYGKGGREDYCHACERGQWEYCFDCCGSGHVGGCAKCHGAHTYWKPVQVDVFGTVVDATPLLRALDMLVDGDSCDVAEPPRDGPLVMRGADWIWFQMHMLPDGPMDEPISTFADASNPLTGMPLEIEISNISMSETMNPPNCDRADVAMLMALVKSPNAPTASPAAPIPIASARERARTPCGANRSRHGAQSPCCRGLRRTACDVARANGGAVRCLLGVVGLLLDLWMTRWAP